MKILNLYAGIGGNRKLWKSTIAVLRDTLPENSLSVGYVGYNGPHGNVEFENLREHFRVVIDVSGECKLCGANAALYTTGQSLESGLGRFWRKEIFLHPAHTNRLSAGRKGVFEVLFTHHP